MAINVNTVYQTVLMILNKEQRGYMTPTEFNKVATQVQLEIFEKYFDDLNQQLRVPQTDTDYADRVTNVDEKISLFKRFGDPTYSNGSFSMPRAAVAATQSFNTTGSTSYNITNISASKLQEQITASVMGVEISSSNYSLSGQTIVFTQAAAPLASYIPALSNIRRSSQAPVPNVAIEVLDPNQNIVFPLGYEVQSPGNLGGTTGTPTLVSTAPVVIGLETVTALTMSVAQNWSIPAKVQVIGELLISSTGSDFYRLGTVIYTAGSKQQELERIDRSELYHLNSSNLTKPSTTYPVYIYENNKIIVYPTVIQSNISMSYIKKPAPIAWGFNTGTNNSYVFDGTTSVDFELHSSEQTEVVLKTLLYAGVVIKDPTIIQVAAQQVQQDQNNQKS